MPTRCILTARDGQNLHLWYGKRDPETGLFYDSSKVTALAFSVYAKDGTELLAPAAGAYVANVRGYVLDWNPGSALDARNTVYVVASPTRHASVAPALAPEEVTPLDVTDTLQRIDEHDASESSRFGTVETNRSTMQGVLVAEHDSTQASLALAKTVVDAIRATDVPAIQANVDATEASVLGDAATKHATTIAEHDATQASLASHEAARASMQSALVTEHDATQASLSTHDAAEAARFATAESARAGMQQALVAEHDATQASLTAHDASEAGRFAAAEAARVTMQNALTAEHDATQASLASHEGSEAGRFVTAEVARVGMQGILVAEHDATQASLSAARSALEGQHTTIEQAIGGIASSLPASQTRKVRRVSQ